MDTLEETKNSLIKESIQRIRLMVEEYTDQDKKEMGWIRKQIEDAEVNEEEFEEFKQGIRENKEYDVNDENKYKVYHLNQIPENELSSFKFLRSTVKTEVCCNTESILTSLKELVLLPFLFPDFFTGIRTPPRAILLFGPEGCGKSFLAKSFSAETKCQLLDYNSIYSSEFQSEKSLKEIYTGVVSTKGYIILIEDAEQLSSDPSNVYSEKFRRRLTELLIQLDGRLWNKNVFTILTSSKPWLINSSLRRRMERRILVDFPEKTERIKFMTLLLDKITHHISKEELEELGEMTKGFCFKDLEKL